MGRKPPTFRPTRREEKPPTSTKGGRSRCVNPERKEEAEGKPTEGRKKQRGKKRNLEIPNDRDRKERIKSSRAQRST